MDDVTTRIQALRESLQARRLDALDAFGGFLESVEHEVVAQATGRSEQLAAMLSRIRVELPGVIYGEAKGVALTSGLPLQIQRESQLT